MHIARRFTTAGRDPYETVVEHQDLATMEIFLVPLGPEGQGMRYEAVFN